MNNKTVLYVFSGTGNCMNIALNLAAELGNTDVVSMRTKPCITDASAYGRVGFIFPCYAGGLPGDVESYARSITIAPGTYTFGVVSFAGYPGCGLSKLHAIHPLNYWAEVPHVSSCIWLMPPITMPFMSHEQAQKRAEGLTKELAFDVKAFRTREGEPQKAALNRLESSVWPKLAPKKAKQFSVSAACVGCGGCASLCPKANIVMQDGHPVFGTDCYQCLGCLQYCPTSAISLGKVTQTREHYRNAKVSAAQLKEKLIHFE